MLVEDRLAVGVAVVCVAQLTAVWEGTGVRVRVVKDVFAVLRAVEGDGVWCGPFWEGVEV